MPVEIRELTVKVTVQDTNKPSGGANSSTDENKTEIIEACIEKVMELLQQKQLDR